MRSNKKGFTLLEILIAIVILGIIMAMNTQVLQEMIKGTRQQNTIVSSQFETALGLEILRADLGNAGYGLPEAFLSNPSGVVSNSYPETCYNEPAGHSDNPAAVASFNDCPLPPKAIAHSNDVGSLNGYLEYSDFLVIRSPAVGMNAAANKWTYITSDENNYVKVWNDRSLDMNSGTNPDYMIVIKARATITDTAQLVLNGGTSHPPFYATYNGSELISSEADVPGFRPSSETAGDRYIAFGIDNNAPVLPFNRADYYVRKTAITSTNCAPGTGTLYKSVVNQVTSGGYTPYAVMDCVANMQVVFRVDTNNDGMPDLAVNSLSGYTASQIKEQVKEIQIYVLAHEGTFDRSYQYDGTSTITVGPNSTLGRDVNLSTLVGADWRRYRWKIYTLIVKSRGFY